MANDLTTLPPDMLTDTGIAYINSKHREAQMFANSAIVAAMDCGAALLIAQEQFYKAQGGKQVGWEQHVAKFFDVPYNTTKHYMRLSKNLSGKIRHAHAGFLSIGSALEILTEKDEEVLEKVNEQVADGNTVTVAELNAIRDELAKEREAKEAFRTESNARRIEIRDLKEQKVVVETVTDNKVAEDRYLAEITKLKAEQKAAHEAHLKAIDDVRKRVMGGLEKDSENLNSQILIRQKTLSDLNTKIAEFQKFSEDRVVQRKALDDTEMCLANLMISTGYLTDRDYGLSADHAREWIKLLSRHAQWIQAAIQVAEDRLAEVVQPKLVE